MRRFLSTLADIKIMADKHCTGTFSGDLVLSLAGSIDVVEEGHPSGVGDALAFLPADLSLLCSYSVPYFLYLATTLWFPLS